MEWQARDIAFGLRRDATESAAVAERERLEAESAEIAKEEAEAELAYEGFRRMDGKVSDLPEEGPIATDDSGSATTLD